MLPLNQTKRTVKLHSRYVTITQGDFGEKKKHDSFAHFLHPVVLNALKVHLAFPDSLARVKRI